MSSYMRILSIIYKQRTTFEPCLLFSNIVTARDIRCYCFFLKKKLTGSSVANTVLAELSISI